MKKLVLKVGKGIVSKSLSGIEKIGNALPHPITLFAIFALSVLVLSYIASLFNLEVIHPGTGDIIRPINLISIKGLHLILTQTVTNFTSFAPLGIVLVALLGIAVAENTGLIGTTLRLMVISAPKNLLTFAIVLTGVLSNVASNVGYVILIPLGAMIFLAVGRHPIAGMAAAFAGVSGGFSANLLLGTVDPLLAGLSTEAARIINPAYEVNPACNYYFMFFSTFIIAIAGTWVTEKIIVPRLGKYEGDEKPETLHKLTADEKRGLIYAGIVAVSFIAFILFGIIPADGYLRHAETGSILKSPFLKGIVTLIFFIGVLMGIAYGIGAKTIKNNSDVIKGMIKSMSTLAMYIVLVFFAAQFIAYFKWSNLGLIIAVKGAMGLKASGLGPIPLMVSFIVMSAIINLFMGSASAKWAIMAPVFIPMFMLLGYTPELVQIPYRIGDSITNLISPMMSFFALILAYFEKYDKKSGIGTVVATMLPYSVVFFLVWTLVFVVWLLLGLPVGPGAGLFL